MPDKKCIKSVWRPGQSLVHESYCSRTAMEGSKFCKQHDPENMKKRDVEREERWKIKTAQNREKWALGSVGSELLWALERVLDSMGALSNPSELSGWAISEEEIARIFKAIKEARP